MLFGLFKLIWWIIKLPFNLVFFIPLLLMKIVINTKIKVWH